MHPLLSTLFASEVEPVVTGGDPGSFPLLIALIPLLPILGFAFTALFGRRLQAKGGRTAAEIVPVVEVDGRGIGSGKPGPVTQRLLEGFRELTKTDGEPIYP